MPLSTGPLSTGPLSTNHSFPGTLPPWQKGVLLSRQAQPLQEPLSRPPVPPTHCCPTLALQSKSADATRGFRQPSVSGLRQGLTLRLPPLLRAH